MNYTNSNRKILITSIVVNIALLTLLCLIFQPSFETNDDSGLLAIVGGSRGVRDPHMVHSNYLMGLLLVKLFEIAPNIQWISALQYVILFVSFVSITYVFFQRFGNTFMRIMIVAALSWFAYEGFIRIQYTKTAGMITAMGLMVLFCGLLKEEISISEVYAGIIISTIGSFYRMQQFYCEVAIFASMVLFLIMDNAKSDSRGMKRTIKAFGIGLALLFIVFGLRGYDRAQYKGDEWASYLKFDKYRTEVLDYGVPKYDENEAEYNAIGIDKTAYDLMKEWTFQDSEKFMPETFIRIAEMKTKKTINAAFFYKYVRGLAKGLAKEGTFLCFIVVALGWLLFGKHGKTELLALAALALIVAALYMYLYYAGRFMIHRVDVGIWLAASLIVLYMYNPDKAKSTTLIPALLIAVLFTTQVAWAAQLRTRHVKDEKSVSERMSIKEVNSDDDHIYLTKVGTLSLSKAYGVFDAMPLGVADNIYPLGGWGAETPVFKSVLQRYGINNPMRDMIDNDKVYLVDNDIDKTVAYLRRWYNPDAKAEPVNEIRGKKIYRIITS